MTFALVEADRDRCEALMELYDVIAVLSKGDHNVINSALRRLGYPEIDQDIAIGCHQYLR